MWALLSRKRYIAYLQKKGASIGDNVYFVNPLHTNFDIGRAAFISIGDDCVICDRVSLIAHDYSWTIPMKAYERIFPTGGGTIQIGNNCFIGENATILRNVHIGNNVIIGAGAVVTKDCQSDSVYAGVPAKRICSLKEYSTRLEACLNDDVIDNIKCIQSKKGRLPLQSEMLNYAFLFLERTDENIEKYIKNMSWNGCDKDWIVRLFKKTKPIDGVTNYDSFINKMKNDVN